MELSIGDEKMFFAIVCVCGRFWQIHLHSYILVLVIVY